MTPWPLIIAFALQGSPGAAQLADIAPSELVTDHGTDSLEIVHLISQQFDAWNSGDIEGYFKIFWRSPSLIYVIDVSLFLGYDSAKAHVVAEFPNKNFMGHAVLEKLQTNFIDKDSASTVEWWTVTFPEGAVHGFSTSTWKRLPEGWRVVILQTASTDLPASH
jgi:hypothetical protein